MKPGDPRMMTLLYSPAEYTHPSHLPDIFFEDNVWEEVLVNYWLLKQKELSDLPNGWQPADASLTQLLVHWHKIPITAHLIGSYLLRNRLLEQPAQLMTDARLLAFISLPLHHQVVITASDSPLDTAYFGAAFILNQFPSLPLALRQRFLLCFPAGMELPTLPAPKTLNHINLLRMALTYAHHYY